jgi:predicted nuclease of predicted toxin-antitoxin system
MRLLFDQNLSRRLVSMLGNEFPESQHVVALGLDTASDHEVWLFAKDQGFVIASKDSDFRQLAFLNGPPPKVLWIRTGNVSTASIAGTPGDAVIANVTATNVTAPGYVTVWPSGPQPTASNLNPEYAGQSIANLVLTRIGPDNKIRLYTHHRTDLIVDTFATIAAS